MMFDRFWIQINKCDYINVDRRKICQFPKKSSKNIAQIVPENRSSLKFRIYVSHFRLTDILVGCGGFRAKVSKLKNIFQQLFSFQLKFKKE